MSNRLPNIPCTNAAAPAFGKVRDGVAEWKRLIDQAMRAGDVFTAAEVAWEAVLRYPDEVSFAHLHVLALARSGATATAEDRFTELRLKERVAALDDAALATDVLALAARLLKDRAQAATGLVRTDLAARSAAAYEEAGRRSGSYYPLINAATMWLIAGHQSEAHAIARTVTGMLGTLPRSYWEAATLAEARLIAGDIEGYKSAASRAADLPGRDIAALSATRRQVTHLCETLHLDLTLADCFPVPPVLCFCGGGSYPRNDHVPEVTAFLDRRSFGVAFGALLGGVDILLAETLLDHCVEVNIVLPTEPEAVRQWLIEPVGGSWPERFDHCLGRATSVTTVTTDASVRDALLVHLAEEHARGLTQLRARSLRTTAWHLAAGTSSTAVLADRSASWRTQWIATGGRTHAVSLPYTAIASASVSVSSPLEERVPRALLFADIRGFSRLREAQIPLFIDVVLGALARAIAPFADAVEYRKTSGDGIARH